jgi:ABC-type multidrug transport system ATPase subunit
MTVVGKGKMENKSILSDVWGEVPAKQTTAIMGPSGAGKTSLLNILAGRTKTSSKLIVEDDCRLDNYSVDPTSIVFRQHIAFVAQDDSLQQTATPREAIRFSAKLRLPRSTTDDELDTLTNRILLALGLMHCAETYIGGPLLKGISGGERKRTSIGVELVVKPSMIFLDEPTSGLDSYSATQVMLLLRKVANAGTSVLFTIHQPASEVFNAFNHLILLNKGRVMYQGSVNDVPTYFETCGRPVPQNYNPADWIMTVAQQQTEEQLNTDGFYPKDERKMGEALDGGKNVFKAIQKDSTHGSDANSVGAGGGLDMRPPSVLTQTSMLYTREFRTLGRDKASLGLRFGITIFLNVLFGIIFFDVGRNSNDEIVNTQSHFGALIMVQLSAMFGTAQPALFAIPEERPIFLREYSTNHYTVGAYFASRFTIEAAITFLQILVQNLINYFLIGFTASFFLYTAVIYALAMASTAVAVLLGCSVSDAKVAQELLPLLFVPQMLFAGFFVAIDLLPSWMQWVQYICSLTYGVRLGLLGEFEECANGDDKAAMNCDMVLENVNADPDGKWWYWTVLAALFVGLRLSAMWILKKKATEFF